MPPPESQKTCIVIPCFNEADRLQTTEIVEFSRDHGHIHFVLVDDGSTDQTGARIDALCAQLPDAVTAIHLDINSGKGEAVRQGVLASLTAAPDFIGYWDADLSAPLSEINRLIVSMQRYPENEAVFGARVKMLERTIERKGYRHYVGRVFATLFSVILDYPVYDTQCGAKLFRVTENIRSVFADPFLTRWLFDVEILARLADICGAGARLDGLVREEPLAFWRHVEGSKIGIQDTLHVLAETYRLWRHYKR